MKMYLARIDYYSKRNFENYTTYQLVNAENIENATEKVRIWFENDFGNSNIDEIEVSEPL